jgi:hypothetical protein
VRRPGGFGPTLAIALSLAFAAFLALMAFALLVVHPATAGLGSFTGFVNQQNQSAKTALYVAAFVVILPLSLLVGGRVADSIARGPNGDALAVLASVLAASLAALLIVIRSSRELPWGNGLKAILAGVVIWAVAAAAALLAAARRGPWKALPRLRRAGSVVHVGAGLLVFGVLICVTSAHSLGAAPLALGALLAVLVILAVERWRIPVSGRWKRRSVDAVVVIVLLFAIPDVVVFKTSSAAPNIFFPPGVIQFQHDYILGPANQLLGGGALLVNVPISQYGVGLIYFVAGWFHLAPIGYGTFAILDGLLTALFYIAAYGVLRVAGVGRVLAGAALAFGVFGLIYALQFSVGALPEEGPLRFGLPMIALASGVLATRSLRFSRVARAVGLCGLGVAAVWAFEAFAYTAVTFVAVVMAEAWLRPPGERRPWLLRQAALGLGACVLAQLLFALATLALAGRLPDWGQYLTYGRAFLFGGKAGAISYGFAPWSPGLAVGAAALGSAAAVLLLFRRAASVARAEPVKLVALCGASVYSIAILSYTDNRSSTYLLPYVALPLLVAGTLWLALLLKATPGISTTIRRGGLAFALSISVLVISSAWPSIGGRFARTALAHALPGGHLESALDRLWHPPPIDPRAPEGERLLDRYMPQTRVLILLPTVPDLGTEILMRTKRANSMFIGDPKADSLVPSIWLPKLRREVSQLRTGQRLLADRSALRIAAALHREPSIDPIARPIDGGYQEIEWLLRAVDLRFQIRPVYRDPDGLVVAELVSRGA